MAWSQTYIAKESAIKDASHLVMLTVDIGDIDTRAFKEKFCRLTRDYFVHLSVIISTDINNANSAAFYENIKVLEDIHEICQGEDKNVGKMFYSLQIVQPSEQTVDTILSVDFNFNMWIIQSRGDRNKYLSNIGDVCEQLSHFPERRKATILGSGGVTSHDDVDWLLQRMPANSLQVIQLATIDYPNIFARTIEVINSFGLTPYLTISADEFSKVRALNRVQGMAEKYKTTMEVLIGRCVLQLGCGICLPISLEEEFLRKDLSRLAHPFLHRKPYVSAFKMISLFIENEDMGTLVAMSDEKESSEDDRYMKLATAVSAPRSLVYS